MKLWSELLDKPEEPEEKEDLLPFIWAAVQGLLRDSRSHGADLTNLGRTIGVDHWMLEKAAGGGGRDGPASLHSRVRPPTKKALHTRLAGASLQPDKKGRARMHDAVQRLHPP